MQKLITQIRQSLGMNQAEFARAIGVSEAQLSRLEHGKRNPGRQALAGLFAVASPQHRHQLQDALLEESGVKVLHPTRGGRK